MNVVKGIALRFGKLGLSWVGLLGMASRNLVGYKVVLIKFSDFLKVDLSCIVEAQKHSFMCFSIDILLLKF